LFFYSIGKVCGFCFRPKSIEIWIKPIENGLTFNEGIIFDSGVFSRVENGVVIETAIVLSLKASGQLFGVIWERPQGDNERETISASDDNAVVLGDWNHVVWMPFSNKFYFNGERSTKATINGISLVDINKYNPNGGHIRIGVSFHGRISLLRLWNFEISDVKNFMDEKISCDLTQNLIGYYDFSYCKQNEVKDFTGATCGYLNPSDEHFLWYNLDAPTSVEGEERFHTLCELESTCSDVCQIPNPLETTEATKESEETKQSEKKNNVQI